MDPFEFKLMTSIGVVVVSVGLAALLAESIQSGILAITTGSALICVATIGAWRHDDE